MWGRFEQIAKDRATLRHVPAHPGWSDAKAGIRSEKDWEYNMAADEQAKKTEHKKVSQAQMPAHLNGETTILMSHQRQNFSWRC